MSDPLQLGSERQSAPLDIPRGGREPFCALKFQLASLAGVGHVANLSKGPGGARPPASSGAADLKSVVQAASPSQGPQIESSIGITSRKIAVSDVGQTFRIRPIQPGMTAFMNNKKLCLLAAAAAFSLLSTQSAFAQKKYDTGASDTEIKIGNVEAYSGPASAYGIIGKIEEAYFKMINDEGGVNGRKINFISYDDGYSPPKTVEQVRKLIESDEVLLIFNALGTPTQTAVQKYQNMKKVPQLFVATGASKWNNPKEFPWTIGIQPSYRVEARIFAKYILKEKPDAKIAVFYQNDDFGKDYVTGLKDVFGDKASSLIVAEESYETTEPSIDNHIVKLKGTGADVFVNISTPKFAAQAIKKMAELEWKPMHVMTDVSISIGSVMKPAGLDASDGILSAGYLKDASDPQWKDDEDMKKFAAFLDKYMPGANVSDTNLVYGYVAAQTMVQVLKQCGDELTRDNVMKQAANLKDFAPGMLIPGIKLNTGAADFAPIKQLKMMQFKAGKWDFFGDTISAETGG
jgi:branched-chain amino acid transport system substrate-binding protein